MQCEMKSRKQFRSPRQQKEDLKAFGNLNSEHLLVPASLLPFLPLSLTLTQRAGFYELVHA